MNVGKSVNLVYHQVLSMRYIGGFAFYMSKDSVKRLTLRFCCFTSVRLWLIQSLQVWESFEWRRVLHGRLAGRRPLQDFIKTDCVSTKSWLFAFFTDTTESNWNNWKRHSFRFFGWSHWHHWPLYLHHHWHVSSKNVLFLQEDWTDKTCHAANIDDFCPHSIAFQEIHSISEENMTNKTHCRKFTIVTFLESQIFYVICQVRTFMQPSDNHFQSELS